MTSFVDEFPNGVELSEDVIQLFTHFQKKKKAVTFDEMTLEDKPSDYHPNDVNLSSWVTRNIKVKACGLLSAAMDTVTEKELALELAKLGGIGIIHRNMDIKTQTRMVTWVRQKINYGGMIDNPITFYPDQFVSDLQREVAAHSYTFTSFPIIDHDGKFLGLVTRDELDFVEVENPVLSSIMKVKEKVITAPMGTDSNSAYQIMKQERVKKLPIVDKEGKLQGMYVWNDVRLAKEKKESYSLDSDGHFLVGAAIGIGEEEVERAKELYKAGCKLIVIDSSHGACEPAKKQIKLLREEFGNKVDIIVGNIASYESAKYLLSGEYKPDALKVGIGPGSICTTRSVTGHGIPQLTAVFEVWRAVKDSGYYVPIIADGGIKQPGDIVKVLAVGASAVMLGSIFAGTAESPGQVVYKEGKKYKTIRGMGSRSAMEERSGSRMRYLKDKIGNKSINKSETITTKQKLKMVPEGVEGLVEFRGPLESIVQLFLGGVQAGISHSGANDIKSFQKKATMWMQSSTGLAEGKPHDISHITH